MKKMNNIRFEINLHFEMKNEDYVYVFLKINYSEKFLEIFN